MLKTVVVKSSDLNRGDNFVFLGNGQPLERIHIALTIAEKLQFREKTGDHIHLSPWIRHQSVAKVV